MGTGCRWGVLGGAGIARKQVMSAIQHSRNGRLVGIASRNAAKARELARTFDIPRSHGSYAALLDDPEIDAVYIPLPNSLHYEWTVRAARAGKHVLCEKPLALNPAQAAEMLAACAQHGVRLMEAFMYRMHPRTVEVLERVRGGVLGAVRLLRASFTFPLSGPENIRLDPALGGGALMDVGCYGVNVSRAALGEPTTVGAQAVLGPSGVDLTTAATLRCSGDAIALVDCSFQAAVHQTYEIVGTEGILRVPHAFRPDWGEATVEVWRGGRAEVLRFGEVNQFVLMVEGFADAVLGRGPLPLPAEDAVGNMRAIEAIRAEAGISPPA